MRPSIDHFVVFLAVGDQAVGILLLELLHFFQGIANMLALGRRDDHVVFAEGNTGFGCVFEAQCHDAVSEQHGFFLAAMTVYRFDDV